MPIGTTIPPKADSVSDKEVKNQQDISQKEGPQQEVKKKEKKVSSWILWPLRVLAVAALIAATIYTGGLLGVIYAGYMLGKIALTASLEMCIAVDIAAAAIITAEVVVDKPLRGWFGRTFKKMGGGIKACFGFGKKGEGVNTVAEGKNATISTAAPNFTVSGSNHNVTVKVYQNQVGAAAASEASTDDLSISEQEASGPNAAVTPSKQLNTPAQKKQVGENFTPVSQIFRMSAQRSVNASRARGVTFSEAPLSTRKRSASAQSLFSTPRQNSNGEVNPASPPDMFHEISCGTAELQNDYAAIIEERNKLIYRLFSRLGFDPVNNVCNNEDARAIREASRFWDQAVSKSFFSRLFARSNENVMKIKINEAMANIGYYFTTGMLEALPTDWTKKSISKHISRLKMLNDDLRDVIRWVDGTGRDSYRDEMRKKLLQFSLTVKAYQIARGEMHPIAECYHQYRTQQDQRMLILNSPPRT